MTGPEHYKEAERCLSLAEDASPNASEDHVALMLRFAEVHATLAVAAATVISHEHRDPRWYEVLA